MVDTIQQRDDWQRPQGPPALTSDTPRGARSAPSAGGTRGGAPRGGTAGGRPSPAAEARRGRQLVVNRRPHPSHRARIVALVSSVTATIGLGAALAHADASAAGSLTVAAAAPPLTSGATSSGALSGSTAGGSTARSTTPAPPAASAPGAAPAATGSSTAAAPTTTAAPATGAATPATLGSPTAGSGAYADGVFTGPSEYTRWGNLQVQVTIHGGRITSIRAVQSPTDGRSRSINSRAQPILESEAVAAQSANIDAVSGATYTSETYMTSLQAALDQAAPTGATTG